VKLKIADDLGLPADEAVTQKYGFIGRSGSGKSYAAMRLAELFLEHGAQVIALDWVGIWWSLRLAADGKAPGFEHVYIFGGEHADVDLRPESGALMADLVVDKHISVVLDVMHFRKAERTRFATAFAEQFFHRKKTARTACHLFIEEAQAYLPQMVRGDEARMVGVFEDIGKVGRNYGIGTSLISQRPQAINKDVLNQVEVLLAFQTNGPQERKAIAGWTSENTDAGAALVQELPKLHVGHAQVWSPQWLRVAKQVHIAKRDTYDASSTPSGKAKTIRPKMLDKADLEQLGEQITATIEKAKADDPRELRKQIAEKDRRLKQLEGEVAKSAGNIPKNIPLKIVERPVLKDGQLRRAEGIVNALSNEVARHEAAVKDRLDLLRELTKELAGAIAQTRAPQPQIPTPAPQREPLTPSKAMGGSRPVPPQRPAREDDGRPLDVSRDNAASRILGVLKQFPGANARRVGALAGVSPRLSTFRVAIAQLRAKGLINGDRGGFTLTEAGQNAASSVPDAPTGPEAIDHWRRELGDGAPRAIFEALVDAAPNRLSAGDLERATGINPAISTFRVAIAKLRNLELIDGNRSGFSASEALF
jgi:hypothetical protein